MTSHELAAKLLALPDLPVCIYEYNGGNTPLREIEEVDTKRSMYSGKCVLLETGGEDF